MRIVGCGRSGTHPSSYIAGRLVPKVSKDQRLAALMPVSSVHKRMIDLIAAAQDQGWDVTRKRKHLRWVPPDPHKDMVFTAVTPSDHRALKNMRAQLRKSGLVID